MKRIIKEINTDSFYKVLLYTDVIHPVSINKKDVDNLFKDAELLTFMVTHGDNVRDALGKLNPSELDFDKATKAILVVRCSTTYTMMASELSELSRYFNENIPKSDIKWGFATNSVSHHNVAIVVATTY